MPVIENNKDEATIDESRNHNSHIQNELMWMIDGLYTTNSIYCYKIWCQVGPSEKPGVVHTTTNEKQHNAQTRILAK